jgi:uncharacterized protein YidB (DUF937 family)
MNHRGNAHRDTGSGFHWTRQADGTLHLGLVQGFCGFASRRTGAEEFKMGFLDEVIGAALGSKATAQYQPAQNQPAQTPPMQDPLAQIAAALTALLAPRPGAAPTGAAPTGATGQQGSLGGLDVLINQFKQSGLEDVVNSWIGTGQNQPISPTQLGQVLGNERVNNLSRQTGAPQEDLLSQLSKYLPGVIDKLTPNGQVPSDAELRSGSRAN